MKIIFSLLLTLLTATAATVKISDITTTPTILPTDRILITRTNPAQSLTFSVGTLLKATADQTAGLSNRFEGGWINANAAWGIKGDGVTDNTTALLTMRTWMRNHDGAMVKFTNGTYHYQTPFFFMGVRNFEADGGNAAWINTANYVTHMMEAVALSINPDYFWNCGQGVGDEISGRTAEEEPNLIQSVNAGSTNVTLITATSTNKFASNSWALVYGWTGIDLGYPPRPMFFEWQRIQGFTAGGVVNFQTPLKNRYDSRWWGMMGATKGAPAAILPLNRAKFNVAERVVLRNFRFQGWQAGNLYPDTGNDHVGHGVLFAFAVNNLLVENCEMGNLSPTMSQNMVIRHCKIGFTEPDALIENLLFDDCDIEYVAGLSGIKNVKFKSCRLLNSFGCEARNAVLEDCDVYCHPGNTYQLNTSGGAPVNSFKTKDCRFWQDPLEPIALVNGGSECFFFCQSSTSATNLLTTDLGTNQWNYSLFPGKRLTHVGGTNEGVLLNMVTNGSATNYILEASFTRQPIAGELYRFSVVKDIAIVDKILPRGPSAFSRDFIYPNAERMTVTPNTNAFTPFLLSKNGAATNVTLHGQTLLRSNLLFSTGGIIGNDTFAAAPSDFYMTGAARVGAGAVAYSPGDLGVSRANGSGYMFLGGAGAGIGNDTAEIVVMGGLPFAPNAPLNSDLGASYLPWKRVYASNYFIGETNLSDWISGKISAEAGTGSLSLSTLTNTANLAFAGNVGMSTALHVAGAITSGGTNLHTLAAQGGGGLSLSTLTNTANLAFAGNVGIAGTLSPGDMVVNGVVKIGPGALGYSAGDLGVARANGSGWIFIGAGNAGIANDTAEIMIMGGLPFTPSTQLGSDLGYSNLQWRRVYAGSYYIGTTNLDDWVAAKITAAGKTTNFTAGGVTWTITGGIITGVSY
jgi:hypothetical protein